MKNVAFLAIAMIFFLLSACEKTAFTPSDPASSTAAIRDEAPCASVDFLTKDGLAVGTLTIEELDDYLKFTFYGDEGWFFRRIHLYTGLLENVPLSEGGIPKVGQFEFSQTYFPYPAYDIFFIARERIEMLEECFIVACQAEIYYIVDETVVDAQYVWADGTTFTSASAATYFEYCLGCEETPPVIPPDDDPDDNLAPFPAESYQSIEPSQKPGAYNSAAPNDASNDSAARIPVNSHKNQAPVIKPGLYEPGNPGPDNRYRIPENFHQSAPPVLKPGAYLPEPEPAVSDKTARIPASSQQFLVPVLKPQVEVKEKEQ